MTSKRFNPEKDLAPLPFDERICQQSNLYQHTIDDILQGYNRPRKTGDDHGNSG